MNHAARRSAVPVDRWRLHLLDAGPGEPLAPAAVREALRGGLPVRVPGSVHGALVGAGLLRDVTVDGTEAEGAWIARRRWAYRTALPAAAPPAAGERYTLVLHGVDTIGRVLVDGAERAAVADMFRRHEIDVTAQVAADDGTGVEVSVELDSTLAAAERAEAANPLPRPDIYRLPYNQVRKMACSFGWDWGPATVTAGLWRPVELERWAARLADVRVEAGWSGSADEPGGARLRVSARAEVASQPAQGPPDGAALRVRLTPSAGGEPLLDERVELAGGLDVPVAAARPWQPVGLGDQPRYAVEVSLLDGADRVLDVAHRTIGFRRVELVQRPDGHGVSCELHVNGARVWVRGLNWIPDDTFPERVTAGRLGTRIGQAVEAGANLLRVWGGGTFESEDFYDVCDRLGVLVWQDFLFACAAYPEDGATVAEVSAEAREAVARLRHRASLAVWCGCNENLWGHEDWGWKDVLGDRPWGARYYHEVLPAVVATLDGTRPYVPGSPFSPSGTHLGDLHPNDGRAGSTHFWETWNRLDYTAFEGYTSRFVAEFGWQAPASWPTLVRAIGGEPGADDERLAVRQKAGNGRELLRLAVERHLPRQPDGPGWYVAAQLVQARAVRTSVPHFRSLHDVCSGTIWWQHNDCWPAISWSLVDVAGRRKLAWYAVREAFAPRLAVLDGRVDGRVDGLRLTLVNDTGEAWTPRLTVRTWCPDGSVRQLPGPATGPVGPHGHQVLTLPAPGAGTELVVADVDGVRSTRWLRPDPELGLPAPHLDVRVTGAGPDAAAVRVSADTVVRDLCLVAELALPDVTVDRQLVTLLPGESTTFTVTGPGAGALTPHAATAALYHEARLAAPSP